MSLVKFIKFIHLFLVISSSKKLFSAMDLHTQTFYSIVDQRFHGEYPLGKPINEVLDDLHKEYSPLSFVEGILQQYFFSCL